MQARLRSLTDLKICQEMRQTIINDVESHDEDDSLDGCCKATLQGCLSEALTSVCELNQTLHQHNEKLFTVKDNLETIFDSDTLEMLDSYFMNKGQFYKFRMLQDTLDQTQELEIE